MNKEANSSPLLTAGSQVRVLYGEAGIAEQQLRDYQARLGKPFTHDAYMSEMAALRDALKGQLSGKQDDSKPQEGPTTGELAAQIKALKAANTIESTAPWIEVQPMRYRYLVAISPCIIRIVIAEYLAAEVAWD